MSLKVWQLDPAQLTPYYNIALCDALAQAGSNVEYYTSPFIYDNEMEYPDTFRTHFHYFNWVNRTPVARFGLLRKAMRGLAYPVGHARLLRRLRTSPPDIVHIQWSRLPVFDLRLIREIQKTGTAVVHTVHNVQPLFSQQQDANQLAQIYAQVDGLVIHTRAAYQDFFAHYPNIDQDKIAIIPLIAAENVPIPQQGSQGLARERLGLPPDAPVILFFGTIKQHKGLDLLLDAYREALTRLPELHLIIAGKPENARMEALAHQFESFPNAYIRASFIPQAEAWIYHLAADVAVFPYHEITQSAAVATVMTCSLPIIVTDIGGLPELVDGNGWIVTPESSAAFADTIVNAFMDREILHGMGRRSREIVDETMSAEPIASAHLQLYQQATERRERT